VSHTGQLLFRDATTDKVAKLSPYSSRAITRTRNNVDRVYTQEHGSSSVLSLTARKNGSIRSGFVARITLGVDPDATPDAVG
jgi:hypothetical protein